MLSSSLLEYYSKPTYKYEPKLGWEQVRPAGGEVNRQLAEQFVKAQGDENLLPSLTSPEVRALLQAEVSIEKNVVLAYHSDEARTQMDAALSEHAGENWKQSEYSFPAREPGNNEGFFSASCGGRVYNQSLTISSKDQEVSLRTFGKQDNQPASHVVSARYDPATGEILPETLTSDFNWNIRRL